MHKQMFDDYSADYSDYSYSIFLRVISLNLGLEIDLGGGIFIIKCVCVPELNTSFLQWHLFPHSKQRMHHGDSQLSLVSLVLRHKIILYYQFSAVRLNITVGPMCQQGFGVRICLLTPSLYAVYNADMSEKKRRHSFCTCCLLFFFFFFYIKKLDFFSPLNSNPPLWHWYVFLVLKNNRKPFRTTKLAVIFVLCNLIWCKLYTADYSWDDKCLMKPARAAGKQ